MIEQWGTEVALVIAFLGTAFITWNLKQAGEQHKSIKRLVLTCNVFCVLAGAIYAYLSFQGVNL